MLKHQKIVTVFKKEWEEGEEEWGGGRRGVVGGRRGVGGRRRRVGERAEEWGREQRSGGRERSSVGREKRSGGEGAKEWGGNVELHANVLSMSPLRSAAITCGLHIGICRFTLSFTFQPLLFSSVFFGVRNANRD